MKIGDKVRVIKKFIPNPNFTWLDVMDGFIGKEYTVKSDIDHTYGTLQLSNGYYFAPESLELIEDAVSSPTHYTSGPIECIDAIRSALTPEEFRGYCKGNVIKYTWREKLKGGNEDIKKASRYLEFIIGDKK